LNHASVLIISDDPEFARTLAARWQAERQAPEITLVTSDLWNPSAGTGCELVIIGPVRPGQQQALFAAINAVPSLAAVYLAENEKDIPMLHVEHPHLAVVARRDGWAETLVLVSTEVLRRVDAVSRAHRAERVAAACQGDAILGRYMLEMRPSVNNALTSVLGNADLLLLEPGQLSRQGREQLQTLHTMALRLNEIMQRFSSLASEMRAGETDSHAETTALARPLGTRS